MDADDSPLHMSQSLNVLWGRKRAPLAESVLRTLPRDHPRRRAGECVAATPSSYACCSCCLGPIIDKRAHCATLIRHEAVSDRIVHLVANTKLSRFLASRPCDDRCSLLYLCVDCHQPLIRFSMSVSYDMAVCHVQCFKSPLECCLRIVKESKVWFWVNLPPSELPTPV